ncbi:MULTISPECIES: LLM class F420-dependent oxidoreductase [unclassified Nocardioides]|uniref:LLM class F420-dependent oxidoreductase n=1 Tax=unclassified Nocardioides TaxID=2615069 RepID=UPI003612EAC2
MRIGISSPVVVRTPGGFSDWEAGAGIEELATVAEAADRLGFHHLTCSEHVAVPRAAAEQRGATYWDPLATFGYLAARTERIRLATQVLVLGYHHPLEIAKRYGTLDRVCGGRLVLGVGVGSLEEEFALLDAAYDDRGARADEAMVALRASLAQPEPEHHGEFYDYEGLVVDPCALQERVPMWVGGRTRRSLRRAVELGDGWVPFGLPLTELAGLVGSVDVPPGFEVVLSTGRLDPLGDPAGTRDRLHRAEDAGATLAGAALIADSADHYCDQLARLAEIAGTEEAS